MSLAHWRQRRRKNWPPPSRASFLAWQWKRNPRPVKACVGGLKDVVRHWPPDTRRHLTDLSPDQPDSGRASQCDPADSIRRWKRNRVLRPGLPSVRTQPEGLVHRSCPDSGGKEVPRAKRELARIAPRATSIRCG